MSFGYMFGWALDHRDRVQHRRHVERAADRHLAAGLRLGAGSRAGVHNRVPGGEPRCRSAQCLAQSAHSHGADMSAASEPVGDGQSVQPASRLTWRGLATLLGGPIGCIGAAIVLLVVLTAVLAPVLAPHDPLAIHLEHQLKAPDAHVLVRHRPGRPRRVQPCPVGRAAVAADRHARGRDRRARRRCAGSDRRLLQRRLARTGHYAHAGRLWRRFRC